MSNTAAIAGSKPIVLAYSGGLDTSFLVPWLAENYGRPIITVTVDTGGIDAATARTLSERARALGAIEHHQVDARADYFEQVLRFLVMGNVKRGQLYPLCVGAERVMQAQTIAHMARKLGTNSIAHGCTAAGNDQVRFEVALRTLAPELEVIAPVRDRAFKRQDELEFLQKRNLPVPPFGAAYSINRGLWGVTIGGKETLTSGGSIPDHAWVLTRDAFTNPRAPERHVISFKNGRPVGLDGKSLAPVAVIEALEGLAAPFGIGRGIHLGDTIIGTKGRVAFEAPAAETLLTAHRELEKLVLTGRQQRIKELVAQPYGDDAQCSASHRSFQCMWTPHHDAGSNADALEAVAADIASCLPDATHDQNSPGRQHFYLGAKGSRTDITLTPAGSNRLRLVVSGK